MMNKLLIVGPEASLEKFRFIEDELAALYQVQRLVVPENVTDTDFATLAEEDPKTCSTLTVCGSNLLNYGRAAIAMHLRTRGFKPIKYVSRNAVIEDGVQIGENSIICGGVYIGHKSRIGYCTVIEPGCYVGANSQIGNSVFLSAASHLGTGCKIGNHVTIGVSAIIRDGLKIGNDCLLGISKVYDKDVEARSFFDDAFDEVVSIYSFNP
jgi:acetyltransferase-like isoleucine patch superfamily enzyme